MRGRRARSPALWYHLGTHNVQDSGGKPVKRLGTLTAIVLVTIGLVVAGGIAGASTRAATSDKPTDSEIGVSSTEIRIAVIADVDNPFAPGLFQGSVDAVNGAAK